MRVVNLQAENYRILRAIDITPEGDVVKIGGDNEQGKTSVLSAIWVALKGRAVAPPTPIREGAEKCRIKLDLGEVVVTRTFTAKDGGTYTDTVKVESADGSRRFNSPQTMLDDLMGTIGFDPFAFVKMKPDDQAETLLGMVPLPIDLEEMAEADEADFQARRDLNREVDTLKAQIAGIPEAQVPADAPDRDALVAKLGNAADANLAIERERVAREERERRIAIMRRDSDEAKVSASELRGRAAALIAEAEGREADARGGYEAADKEEAEFKALPPLDEPIDTQAVREELQAAEAVAAEIERQTRRKALIEQHDAKAAEAQGKTDLMDAREQERRAALAKAKMPIDGLGFSVNDKGKAFVTFGGLPFGDASSAQQIKVSTAIAMAANPELRVLQIRDGSLLDSKSMAIIAEMAEAQDYQVWCEVVATDGVGIVLEDGSIKGAPEPQGDDGKAKSKGRAKPPADKPEGSLL